MKSFALSSTLLLAIQFSHIDIIIKHCVPITPRTPETISISKRRFEEDY
jgi:hypothetical protein